MMFMFSIDNMAAAPPVKLYAFSPATVNHSQTYLVLHPSHHPFCAFTDFTGLESQDLRQQVSSD
jgi:hypothetical protein